MPEAAIPLVAEEAVGTTAAELTAEQIAAQQLLAEQQAAAALEAQQAAEAAQATQQATNEAIRNTVTQTPVSGSGSGGISNLVNTTGGPTTWEQIFSQGQNIAEGSTELGKVANASSTVPFSSGLTGTGFPVELTEASPVLDSATQFPTLETNLPPVQPAAPPIAPTAPPPTAPAMPPPEYGFTGTPPAEPLVESAATTPVNPSNPVQATSTPLRTSGGFDTAGFENLSGIETLAKEVGAQSTSAFNTAPTLTQYGAGAPVSTPLTSATPFNPAAPMANPTYAQPSGLQGLQTNLSGPLGSNLTPSVTNAVTSAGTDATSQQAVREGVLNNYANPNIGESVFESPYAQQPIEQGGKSLYDLNGIATGNPSPPVDNPLAPNQITRYAPPGGTQMRDVVAKDAVEWAGGNANQIASAATPAATPEAGGLQGLWKDFTGMSLKDKALTGLMASSAYQMMNQPKPYEKPKYKSTWNAGAYSGYQPIQPTPYTPHYVQGGLADLGGYSDGGRMLKGPGDGMSDDIPATIANKQPARLANEEFVVPADVVSHLGNGSSEAGAKVLYKMMDRVRQARTGNKKQGKQINPEKYLA